MKINIKVSVHNSPCVHENSLSMACCTFGVLEVRTITPNRFTNQSSGTLKILAHNWNHQQGLVKQKTVALHHCGFKTEFPKPLIKSTILGKIYQCSTRYAKLEQHCIECICVHSSPIFHLFDHKKFKAVHLSAFSQKFPNWDLFHFL